MTIRRGGYGELNTTRPLLWDIHHILLRRRHVTFELIAAYGTLLTGQTIRGRTPTAGRITAFDEGSGLPNLRRRFESRPACYWSHSYGMPRGPAPHRPVRQLGCHLQFRSEG